MIIRGRVHHEEWTRINEDGSMCGVGYRGYWTNRATYGEPIFKQRKDGTWYDPKDPEKNIVSMSLGEFLASMEGEKK